jgi:hypothetical protein
MNDSVQSRFDFKSGNMGGYGNWRREQQQRLQAILREWALPV